MRAVPGVMELTESRESPEELLRRRKRAGRSSGGLPAERGPSRGAYVKIISIMGREKPRGLREARETWF